MRDATAVAVYAEVKRRGRHNQRQHPGLATTKPPSADDDDHVVGPELPPELDSAKNTAADQQTSVINQPPPGRLYQSWEVAYLRERGTGRCSPPVSIFFVFTV